MEVLSRHSCDSGIEFGRDGGVRGFVGFRLFLGSSIVVFVSGANSNESLALPIPTHVRTLKIFCLQLNNGGSKWGQNPRMLAEA